MTDNTSKTFKNSDFLPNYYQNWQRIVNSHMGEYGGHNPGCSINSDQCSTEMATNIPENMGGLCVWHRARMARHLTEFCGCQRQHICDGDAIGRNMFWDYYKIDDLPVIDMGNQFYCCRSCQNTDGYVAKCGSMYVCENHKELHDSDTLVSASFDDSDSDY